MFFPLFLANLVDMLIFQYKIIPVLLNIMQSKVHIQNLYFVLYKKYPVLRMLNKILLETKLYRLPHK